MRSWLLTASIRWAAWQSPNRSETANTGCNRLLRRRRLRQHTDHWQVQSHTARTTLLVPSTLVLTKRRFEPNRQARAQVGHDCVSPQTSELSLRRSFTYL